MNSPSLSDLTEEYSGEAFRSASRCPICDGLSKVLHSALNIHPEKPYTFNFRICSECGHGWIDPMPTQGLLDQLYSRGSRSVLGEWGHSPLTIPERFCAKRELRKPPGCYFELGVGQGHLYELFVDRKWDCTGVDPGDWAARFPNVVRNVDEVRLFHSANLLTAFDVLEHVADPLSILRRIRRFAAPNAKFYCAMPNRDSLKAKRGREQWRMLRPLGHVNYYTKRSISIAMDSSGFNLSYICATDLYELRIPRSFVEVKAMLIEILGLGDQLIAVGDAK